MAMNKEMEEGIVGHAMAKDTDTKDKWDQITGYCCGSCRYFSPKVNSEVGRCRRHAPTMQGYPVVYAVDDWCGDHKIGTNPHKG